MSGGLFVTLCVICAGLLFLQLQVLLIQESVADLERRFEQADRRDLINE